MEVPKAVRGRDNRTSGTTYMARLGEVRGELAMVLGGKW
jgi:hypothetical protein